MIKPQIALRLQGGALLPGQALALLLSFEAVDLNSKPDTYARQYLARGRLALLRKLSRIMRYDARLDLGNI